MTYIHIKDLPYEAHAVHVGRTGPRGKHVYMMDCKQIQLNKILKILKIDAPAHQ